MFMSIGHLRSGRVAASGRGVRRVYIPRGMRLLLPVLMLVSAVIGRPTVVAAQPAVLQVIDNPLSSTVGFGNAMDVDGGTLVVGASGGLQRGAVSVYTNVGGSWVLQQSLTRSTGVGFGSSVAVSGDTLIAATEYYSPLLDPGPLVFVRQNGTWTQQAELRPSRTGYRTGARVALDGNTALIATVDAGVYAFVRSGATWTEQQQLLPEGAYGTARIQIVLEGDTALVGVPGETVGANAYQGAVHVWNRAGSIWTRQGTLTSPGARASEYFGIVIALSGDTAFIRGDHVYQYARIAGVWVRQPSLRLPLVPLLPDVFTYQPLAVTLDGDTAIVTMNVDPRAPAYAYVYRRVDGRWIRLEPPGNPLKYMIGGGFIFGADSGTNGRGRVIVFSTPPVLFTGPPGPPDFVRASVSGNTLTMTWEPPQTGGAPTGYTLIAREFVDGPVLGSLLVGPGTSFSGTAPNGEFVLSLTASNAHGTGPESSEVHVFVPTWPRPVGAPSNLTATVSGATITFSWDPPLRGVATSYVLWAGVTPNVNPPLVTVPLGNATSFVANDVPPGTYYVFVQARDASSASGASNVVAVTVAGQSPPGAPTLNAPVVSGSTVSLSWTPGTGGAPTSYALEVSATPGGAALVTVPLAGTSAAFPNVPRGTYDLRLTATNHAGTSGPSAVVTLVVP